MKNNLLKGLIIFIFSFLTLYGIGGADAAKVTIIPAPTNSDKHCIVGIAQGEKGAYEETVRQAISAAGGLSSVIKEGDTVLIKPNIVAASPSGAGRITDYRVVQVVIDMALEAGADKVIVAESPISLFARGSFELSMAVAGYDKIERAEVRELNTSRSGCYLLKPENSLSGEAFYLPKIYIDADVVIDVPVLKTHDIAGVTLGLKNIGIGVPPEKVYGAGQGWKKRLHDIGVHKVIVDVNAIRAPDFVVIDGMVGGEGEGPQNPTPVESNLVIAGQNVVAVDMVGTLVMGFDPWQINYLVWAAAQGIGPMDTSLIEVRGKQILEVQQYFEPPDPLSHIKRQITIIKHQDELIANESIVIDGSLSEWSGAWPNRLGDEPQIYELDEDWAGEMDASADFMLLHDFDNLYFAFSIEDDDFQTGPDLEEDLPTKDALIICMSRNNAPQQRDFYDESQGDLRLLIQNLEDGIQTLTYPDFEVIENVEVKRNKTETGYILEGKIPIKELSGSPFKEDETIFIDFVLFDIDKNEDPVQLIWNVSLFQLFDDPQECGWALID